MRLLVLLICFCSSSTSSWANTDFVARSPLYNLSAGTTLLTRQPIVLRANNSTELLYSSSALQCSIRVKDPSPYDRVLPKDHRLIVRGAKREALTTKNSISSWTRIQMDSGIIDEIICKGPPNMADPKIGDFIASLGRSFEIQVAPPVAIAP